MAKYAVVDVETTGLKPVKESITELAVILMDEQTIEKEWHTLINPTRLIPAQITRLTGISNQMVADAPKFYEIARELVLMTEGRILVAHNAPFDYSFIREEFRRLGYDYRRKKKCTVQLSRRLLPGLPSYSLGAICRNLGIVNHARHRALGDAKATADLFRMLLQQSSQEIEAPQYLPPAMSYEDFQKLPEKTGVYYFVNTKNSIIYIGKSLNIKERVKSHFASMDEREQKMKMQTAFVDYQITGSELVALLIESAEIKKYKPLFNRRQRRMSYHYGLFHQTDQEGYIQLKIARINTQDNPLITFSSAAQAKDFLNDKVTKYQLCQKYSGLYKSDSSCFHYQVGQCFGACVGEESPDDYNVRVRAFLEEFSLGHKNLLIIDPGRSCDERSLILIWNDAYRGFGFVDKNEVVDRYNVFDFIQPFEDNRDVRQIIKTYLKQEKPLKLIKL